jgi:hypothetical protein
MFSNATGAMHGGAERRWWTDAEHFKRAAAVSPGGRPLPAGAGNDTPSDDGASY